MEDIHFDAPDGSHLGISITGGTDDQVREGDDAVYIKKVIQGGLAANDGRLRDGDRLR